MTRDLLRDAAGEIDAAIEAVTDPEVRDSLETHADRLRSQAEREATPALGALDRIQNGLADVAADDDDETVVGHLERAREGIFDFLGTLDDRGMTQHGWTEDGANDAG